MEKKKKHEIGNNLANSSDDANFFFFQSAQRGRVRQWQREQHDQFEQDQALRRKFLRPWERWPRDLGTSSGIGDLWNICDLSVLCNRRRHHRRPVRRSALEVSANICTFVQRARLVEKAPRSFPLSVSTFNFSPLVRPVINTGYKCPAGARNNRIYCIIPEHCIPRKKEEK